MPALEQERGTRHRRRHDGSHADVTDQMARGSRTRPQRDSKGEMVLGITGEEKPRVEAPYWSPPPSKSPGAEVRRRFGMGEQGFKVPRRLCGWERRGATERDGSGRSGP